LASSASNCVAADGDPSAANAAVKLWGIGARPSWSNDPNRAPKPDNATVFIASFCRSAEVSTGRRPTHASQRATSWQLMSSMLSW